ncbi:uncharacterized protein RAG0_05213 [Rhynchosporium agropyri]|uniref:Isochorismatase-like domain-containing protein n=1 Tax=Rhynchosporium agropyri TaxID=914238 RepID=A0A1E1KC51_9HELO|nr:uncharacterized protein RAG0_05213 [Rhynchosporium agropyri]
MPDSTVPPTSIIGNISNFWLFNENSGFDLTHPSTPQSPFLYPRLKLHTTNTPITICPPKTALVIIDMQNFFLSTALGRPRGPGHNAEDALLAYGIPAARRAGIQIVWVTWGLTDEDLSTMPPATFRAFSFRGEETGFEDADREIGPKRPEVRTENGLGFQLGEVKLEDGSTIEAGRMLFRDQWNSALHGRLTAAFEDGLKAPVPDVQFHKNRISALWEPRSDLHDFLKERGFRTLMFTGVNTDQCVLATVQDAALKGYDTVLLRDGCGTPRDLARDMVEFNCGKVWGFVSSCVELTRSVDERLDKGPK